MKLLFVDNGKEWGGGTESLFLLLEGLQGSGFDIRVAFEHDYPFRGSNVKTETEKLGYQFIQFPQRPPLSKIKREFLRGIGWLERRLLNDATNQARRILKEVKPDVMHLNNHPNSNIGFIVAANELGMRVVQHLRKNSPLTPLVQRLASQSQAEYVAICQSNQRFYASFGIVSRVIYNPFDLRRYGVDDFHKRSPEESIRVLMPANFLPLKGHQIVFEAFRSLKRRDIKLYLAGKGKWESQTEELKKKLEESGLVEELGFVDVISMYPEFDYVINFSENEGFPRTILEALNAECSIVMSDIPVAHELKALSGKGEDFMILPRSAGALADCLETLRVREIKYSDIAPGGWRDQFSIKRHVEEMRALFADQSQREVRQ